MNFQKRYNQLNAEQKLAVDTLEGPVLVVAGPGTGKTELISLRVANILRQTDLPASSILCLTYTKAAAHNMRLRLRDLIGEAANKVAIHTFHSFGSEIINHYPAFFYQGASMRPAEELVQTEILNSILKKLSFDDPLNSFRAEQGYTYLRDIKSAIGDLKKAGLTPDQFIEIIEANRIEVERLNPLIEEICSERVSKSLVESIILRLDDFKPQDSLKVLDFYTNFGEVIYEKLSLALLNFQETGKTSAFTDWKTEFTVNEEGRRVLKESTLYEKRLSLANIYRLYQQELSKKGFFDYDDMLLELIQALETKSDLLADLQEKYLSIFVDEFQDTNDAQLKILRLLCDNPLNEGQPNILVVGDDDQAIFKFQGAQLKNIFDFKDQFGNPQLITLVHNYRSTQNILDLAIKTIRKAGERLEFKYSEINKELFSHHLEKSGFIEGRVFKTFEEERCYVTQKIESLLAEGTKPNQIAVIARTHNDLIEFSQTINSAKTPFNFTYPQNILEEGIIRQIVCLSRFICSLARKTAEADEFMPELLSYPFWELNPTDIYKLSIKAFRDRKTWLEIMLESENIRFNQIAELFLDLALKSEHLSLEKMLEQLLGATEVQMPEDEFEELEPLDVNDNQQFSSPLKAYYFSTERFNFNPNQYLKDLKNLRFLFQNLRNWRPETNLKLCDLLTFITLIEENNLKLLNENDFFEADDAVQLLTVHKAKGLEFEHVFIIGCNSANWEKNHSSNKISHPLNLPISHEPDSDDDKLRLFFVAMTRAKKHLYLSRFESSESGRELASPSFLTDFEWIPTECTPFALAESLLILSPTNLNTDQKAILKAELENYKLNVTSFNNYLDVERGGPENFLKQNLLRFPQPKTFASSFGTAIHDSIAKLHTELKKTGTLPDLQIFLEIYAQEVNFARLDEIETKKALDKGLQILTNFHKYQAFNLTIDQEIEFDFKSQGVHILNDIPLAGKIDLLTPLGKGKYKVSDYKTGRSIASWDSKVTGDPLKLHRYRYQLLFYKLLLENSRAFGGKSIAEQGEIICLENPDPLTSNLILEFDEVEVENLKLLIQKVYQNILNLNFPSTEEFPPTLKGQLAFEAQLLGQAD